jgi:hypothetical protein
VLNEFRSGDFMPAGVGDFAVLSNIANQVNDVVRTS